MLIEAAVLGLVYAGITYIGQKRQESLNNIRRRKLKERQRAEYVSVTDQRVKKYNRYFLVSAATCGITFFNPLNPALLLLNFGAILYTILPMIREGLDKLINKRTFGHDILLALLLVLLFATGQYLPLVLGTVFYHLGKKILATAQQQSEKVLIGIIGKHDHTVWIQRDQIELEIPLQQVRTGDIVVVNTGQVIPIDGRIVEGEAMLDQFALTGESTLAEKGIGERVYASTIVMSGKIKIQVEKTGREMEISRIEEIVNQTNEYQAELVMKGEAWADKTAIPILGTSVLLLPVFGGMGALAFINSGFGNRIRLLGSLSTLNHINVAFQGRILIKDGRALEELSEVDTVLFDKTGTLTSETPRVGKVMTFDDFEEKCLLALAAAAEKKLSHPVAIAIKQKAEELSLTIPEIDDASYQIGYGITVEIEKRIVRVGSARFMKLSEVFIPDEVTDILSEFQQKGNSLVLVAINEAIKGAIEIQPSLRHDIAETIRRLKHRGIKQIAIVSGDHDDPTKYLAEKLDVDCYFAESLPENKATLVEDLQKQGRSVCFIGDGINDAIAMKKANVSISLQGATNIATDVAQIIFMDDNVSNLDVLFDLSRQGYGHLSNALKITIIPAFINASGTLIANFGVMTTTIINNIGWLAGFGHAMLPLKRGLKHKVEPNPPPDQESS